MMLRIVCSRRPVRVRSSTLIPIPSSHIAVRPSRTMDAIISCIDSVPSSSAPPFCASAMKVFTAFLIPMVRYVSGWASLT